MTAVAPATPPAGAPVAAPTTTTTAAAGASTSGAQVSSTSPGTVRVATGRFASTPSRMRLVLALAVLASIVFGAVGLQAGLLQSAAAADARAEASHLVALRDLQNDLLDADAVAANAFLVGGLESAEQRAAYVASIEAATRVVTRESGESRQDAAALGAINADLATYTGLIEQARANNRQGFPVGSAYLDQASTLLRSGTAETADAAAQPGTIQKLDAIIDDSADRLAVHFATARGALWLLAGCVIALAGLVACQLWLTRRTHRYLNPSLVIATGLVLVLGIGGTVVFGSTASTIQTTRETSYAATLAVSRALTSASDAKSLESFTLIKRGSGQTIEADVRLAIDDAASRLEYASSQGVISSQLQTELGAWSDLHQDIRDADNDGRWDDAVALAVSTGADGANAAFTTFSADAAEQIQTSAAETSTALQDAGTLSLIAGWVLLLTGIASAVLAWRGVSVRLREYR